MTCSANNVAMPVYCVNSKVASKSVTFSADSRCQIPEAAVLTSVLCWIKVGKDSQSHAKVLFIYLRVPGNGIQFLFKNHLRNTSKVLVKDIQSKQ